MYFYAPRNVPQHNNLFLSAIDENIVLIIFLYIQYRPCLTFPAKTSQLVDLSLTLFDSWPFFFPGLNIGSVNKTKTKMCHSISCIISNLKTQRKPLSFLNWQLCLLKKKLY